MLLARIKYYLFLTRNIMAYFNYQKICSDLIDDLPQRQKEVISRRFGLDGAKRETLESIGQDFGICRERTRQIQETGLAKIKPKLDRYETVFQSFLNYFEKFGGLKREDILLADLGGEKHQNEVYFLLNLKQPFQKLGENNDFYYLWLISDESFQTAKKSINVIYNHLQKIGKPLTLKDFVSLTLLKKEVLNSYLEISKQIQKNKEGFYGLKDWPEINPRGIKDKAFLVFKKMQKPLHFSIVANLIAGANLQTVHNELIRDARFVLVGRGIYALKEWGYSPGQVKDVIFAVLKEKGPLAKEDVLKKVLEQRQVKENTILLNLSNKKYFLKDPNGRYRPKTAII